MKDGTVVQGFLVEGVFTSLGGEMGNLGAMVITGLGLPL